MGAPFRDRFTPYRYVVFAAVLSTALSFGMFFTDGNVGINLADEGYLWYGMRALKAGLVPIRDFQAYDPGRYIWTALWSCILGDGLVSMRFSCVIFQCFGIVFGLLVARRISNDWRFIGVVGLILVQWMIPTYKVFEQSISLAAVYVAVLLIERPTIKRHFCAGLFVGLAAFMGRNHGLYNTIAFGLLFLLLARGAWREAPLRLASLAGGVVLGYLPQLAMFAFVPGYFASFLALLHRNVSIGSNLAMPVPWPWTTPIDQGFVVWLNGFVEGLFYLCLPLFIFIGLLVVFRLSRANAVRNAVLVASACVALPYAHHTFSRADSVHLTHSVPVLALGIIALCHFLWPSLKSVAIAAVALCFASAPATFVHGGLYAELTAPAGTFVERQVLGETMHVGLYHDLLLTLADRVANKLAKPEEQVVFLPHWPGLYAFTNRISPLKQIYFIRPASPPEEEAELLVLRKKDVRWVLLRDYKLDGRDELRFRNTNPLIFKYFTENFEQLSLVGVPRDTVVLRRK